MGGQTVNTRVDYTVNIETDSVEEDKAEKAVTNAGVATQKASQGSLPEKTAL